MDRPPVSEQFDDVYFSADGGPEETRHVFLDGNNLPAAWQDKPRFAIGETGFGTGLNFLLAWEMFDHTAQSGAFLDFVSVEKYPLTPEQIRTWLAPWAGRLGPYLDKMLGQYPILVPGFHRMVFDGRVALTLVFGDGNEILPQVEGAVDAWFLDGFTPSKNPDMWTQTLFDEMARLSHAHTTLATFTAAGFVKRGLQAAGFTVEKAKGFGRKRDMLVGRAGRDGDAPLAAGQDFAQHSQDTRPRQAGRVHIVGAGLAGTACADVLKSYGYDPVLYDPGGIAGGASGNPLGLINPRFSAFRDAQSDFYTAAFAHTVRRFAGLEQEASYHRCGTLHLIYDADKQKKLTRTAENWGWAPEHMKIVDAAEASVLAGIALEHPALYLPDSAMIDPASLCRVYAGDIEVKNHFDPQMIATDEPVIFACGVTSAQLAGIGEIPLHTVRGQIAFAPPTAKSAALRTNLSYGGYISPARDGGHVVGSTFQKWRDDTDISDDDNEEILQRLAENVASEDLAGLTINGARASLRTAARDRFPVIGAVPGIGGRYISTAHGSHGIIGTLMGAHLIADLLRGGVLSLGRPSVNALSPQRFLKNPAP